MGDTGKVNTGNTGKKNDRTGNFPGRGYRKQSLRGLWITVSEEVVQAVIDYCSRNSRVSSLYQLYTNDLPTFQAAKGTISKIKKRYESGALADYMKYLDSERLASGSEVVAPTKLNANRTTQAAKSDGARPGVLAQLPAPFNMAVIKSLLNNELAKTSVVFGKLDEALKAHMTCQFKRIAQPTFRRSL